MGHIILAKNRKRKFHFNNLQLPNDDTFFRKENHTRFDFDYRSYPEDFSCYYSCLFFTSNEETDLVSNIK